MAEASIFYIEIIMPGLGQLGIIKEPQKKGIGRISLRQKGIG